MSDSGYVGQSSGSSDLLSMGVGIGDAICNCKTQNFHDIDTTLI
jgi:hypothetical protein